MARLLQYPRSHSKWNLQVDDVWIEATAFGPPDGDAADLLGTEPATQPLSSAPTKRPIAHDRFGVDRVISSLPRLTLPWCDRFHGRSTATSALR